MRNDSTTQYPFPYTSEQVLGLAQHDYQVKTSRELAVAHKWQALGKDDQGIWAEIPVKDKTPIQTNILLMPLLFSCSCVSYHYPCQHSLGLMLLWLENPEIFSQTEAPEWLTRSETADVDEAELEFSSPDRQARIGAGLSELELWLFDLIRSGLEVARTRPPTYYQQMADRLVDATLSEVAKDIRQLASISAKNPRWHEDYLSSLGRLHLLIQGFKHLDEMPREIAADLRTALGWLPDLESESVKDTWHVLGRRVEAEVNRKIQRTYLWAENQQRPALLTDVLQGKQSVNINTRFLPGVVLEATLRFCDGSTPLLAEVTSLQTILQPETHVDGESSLKTAMTHFITVKTANPWVRSYPLLLQDVVAEQHDGNWILRDSDGYFLSLPPRYTYGWYLRALSAGGLWIFGDYDGSNFLPMSTWANDRLLELHTLKSLP